MTTPIRIEANRRNTLKSSELHTPPGKAIAGRNALRHGFHYRNALLPGENPDDYLDLLHLSAIVRKRMFLNIGGCDLVAGHAA